MTQVELAPVPWRFQHRQGRHPMTETTAELNEALAAAQAEFPPIAREKTVTVRTRDQGTYSFSYATLDAILNAVRPALNKHGLSIVQLLEADEDGRPQIRSELRHKSGGVLSAAFPLVSVPQSPQQLGSLLTYLRRYTITALLGVAAEEDDDGRQAAQAKPAKPKPKPEPEPEPEPEFDHPGEPELELVGPSPQMRLNAWLARRGLAASEPARTYVSAVVGREIESSADLTNGEIEQVIELLQDDTTEWPNAGS